VTPTRDWPLFPALTADPMALLIADHARASEARDPHCNFATFITAGSDGQPHGRTVTLRELRDDALLLSANATSPKVRELRESGRCELLVYWSSVQRQYRLRGTCEFIAVSDEPALAQLYRQSPHRARVWDWFYAEQPQSTPVADRESVVARFEEISERLLAQSKEPAELAPASGAGYLRLVPTEVEIQALDLEWRLHDRRSYRKQASGDWEQSWLVP
jgi:pyridoxamine 5'-phosphate oxidase